MAHKRVVFIGASNFGLKCLKTILGLRGVIVVGAVTAPRQFQISYSEKGVTNVLHADITSVCEGVDIPVVTITGGMNDAAMFQAVSSWEPDMFIVAGWYHMIPKKWRDLAPAYGLHASLLPDYSGGAPLVWAMINGEKKTGITLFQLDNGVDNGMIAGQAETPIHPDDTIATLYARIEHIGVQLLADCLPKLADGTAILLKQDESKRRIVPQRKPEDGLINWNQSGQKIHDFVRAQTKPYPGAFTNVDGKKITIWSGRALENTMIKPGAFILEDGYILFGCDEKTAYCVEEMAVDGQDISPKDYILTSLKQRVI